MFDTENSVVSMYVPCSLRALLRVTASENVMKEKDVRFCLGIYIVAGCNLHIRYLIFGLEGYVSK